VVIGADREVVELAGNVQQRRHFVREQGFRLGEEGLSLSLARTKRVSIKARPTARKPFT
jgi:hypothetical protein